MHANFKVPAVCSLQGIVALLQILSCGKQLQVWGGKAGAATYYDMIARDKEIVKVVLLLTGSIEGTKESVLEYISSFDKYKFLWQKDLATEYAAFMSTSPSLEVSCSAAYALVVGPECMLPTVLLPAKYMSWYLLPCRCHAPCIKQYSSNMTQLMSFCMHKTMCPECTNVCAGL